MTSRLKTLVLHDLRLQGRYGILPAYGFVVFAYVMFLYFGGEHIPRWLVATIIYTDPAALGFFFLGGLMMLEKSENVRTSMAMTPVSATEYLLSKSITLTAIALVAVMILTLFVQDGVHVNVPLLLLTVLFTSVFFVSVGLLVAQRTKTVTAYIMGSIPVMLPVVAPMFFVALDPYPAWANLIPTTVQFWLVLVALGSMSGTTMQILFALCVLISTSLACFWAAQRQLQKEFGSK